MSIVYASYDHLVLSTRKYTETESGESIRFIVDTIQSRDVFRLLNFLNQSTFGALIWYNPNNFTGYRVWNESMEDQDTTDRQVWHDFWYNILGRNCDNLVVGTIIAGSVSIVL